MAEAAIVVAREPNDYHDEEVLESYDEDYKDIDAEFYKEGRPEELTEHEHPRGQAIRSVDKMKKEECMAELNLRDPLISNRHTIKGNPLDKDSRQWLERRAARAAEPKLEVWRAWVKIARRRDRVAEPSLPTRTQRKSTLALTGEA